MKRQSLFLGVLIIASVYPAVAATHFVGICGNPSSASISEAVNVAAAGDTIKICPGNYFEQTDHFKVADPGRHKH